MLDALKAGSDRGFNDVGIEDRAALRRQSAALPVDGNFSGAVANNQAPVAAIADQDVGADAQQEVRKIGGSCDSYGTFEFFDRFGFKKDICWTADLERGIRGKNDVSPNAIGAKLEIELLYAL